MAQSTQVKGGLGGTLDASELGCLPLTTQMIDHTMVLAGVSAKKFFFDAKANVEASALVDGYYGFSMLTRGADAYNFEIEALGGKMVYGENSMPTVDHRDLLIKKPEDLEKLKNKKIDFRKAGRFSFALELIKLNTEYGISPGMYCSPFSLAVAMRGYPALYRDMRKNPKFYDELMTYIVDDVLVPWIKVQNEETGALLAIGADAWASVPNLSVKEMMDWVVPYNQKLSQKAKKLGVLTADVSGLYQEERPEKFDPKILQESLEVQLACSGNIPAIYVSQGHLNEYPLEPVVVFLKRMQEQGKKIPVTLTVNAQLIRDGPIERIVNTIKHYIKVFGRDHQLSLLLANIPADAPSDHVHAAVAAINTYGRLPIADNLDDIKFTIPKKESFQEWRKINSEKKAMPKVEVRNGLAGLLWAQMEHINHNLKFKELHKDTKMSILYNLTDQKYGALITIDKGKINVKHVNKDKETLKGLTVDASMACTTELFFDFGSGKISKLAILGKMLTGKLKIKGAKQMQEFGKIMAL